MSAARIIPLVVLLALVVVLGGTVYVVRLSYDWVRASEVTEDADPTHPEAGNYLAENVGLNNGKPITFIRTSWVDTLDGLGKFDVIIGSDVLYEREHVELLVGFIKRHSNPNCEVIIVDPGRHHHAPFSKKMT